MIGVVSLSASMILVVLTVAVLALLEASSHARRRTGRTTDVALGAAELRLDLEQMLASERASRLAPDAASLERARIDFDRATRNAVRSSLRLDPGAFAPALELAKPIGAIRAGIPPLAATLRGLMPARVGSSLQASPSDRAVIDVPGEQLRALERLARGERVRDQRRVARIEREVSSVAVGGVVTFVALLTALAIRLVLSRSRLLDARLHEALETARLEEAIAHMRDGVAVFDAGGALAFRNERLAAETGLPKEDCALGTPFEQVARALSAAVPDLLAGPNPQPGAPLAGTALLGSRTLEIYRSAMPGGGQMLAVTDITHLVEAEALAQQAQRMDVLGRLTGGIAHDFNNLLQALSTNVETARSAAPPDPELEARLRATADGIARGIRLTRHLLAFARRQELRSAPIDLAALLADMTDLLGRTLGDHIAVACDVAPDLWPVLGDRAQLENALLNVALNARDAMGDGGTLTIVAANEPESDGSFVRIALRDTGVGMTGEELERAIEPFYTTKPEGQGTGLGLSLVHGFARQSGGRLLLASRKGVGTEVALILPRAEAAPVAAGVPDEQPRQGYGELVLLVEDDAAVLDATRAALEFMGYRVRTASDPDAAWAILRAGLRPALLFSDVMMPGEMDVAELVRRTRQLHPGMPVLLNTGNLEAPVLRRIPLDERTVLLGKPWRLAALSSRLQAMLDEAKEMADRSTQEA